MKTRISKIATLQVEAEVLESPEESTKIIPYIKIQGRWLEDFGFYLEGKVTLTAKYGLLMIEAEEQEVI